MSLPLVPFEYYLLADDRPDYPMTMCVTLHFTGVFDRPTLERSLQQAILRHPLLHSYIREGRRGRLEWVEEPNPQPYMSWDRLGVPWDFPQGMYIDLRREIGVRMLVRQDDEHSQLLVQVHHACCDGLGMMQFLEDFVVTYHGERRPEARVDLREHDPSLVARRGKFGLTPLGLLRRIPQELLGLLGAVEFLAHRPAPVAIPRPLEGENRVFDSELPAMLSHRFSPEEVKQLRNVAKAGLETTLNDVLLRDLFLALGDWTEEHDPKSRNRVVRIMVPVNLRNEDDKCAPAANIMSMVNLDRRPSKFRSPQSLLRGLAWEMRIILKQRLGLTLIHLVWLARKVGLNLEALVPEDRCLATAVLSNVGRFPTGAALPRKQGRCVIGDLVLDDIEGHVVLRPYTRAAFLIIFYGGSMILTMSYDHMQLSAAEARQFLDTFLSRIQRTLAEVPTSDLVHSS